MKKIIYIVLIIIIFSLYLGTTKDIVIPKESIRFRIIANSNDPNDQLLKLDIKKDLEDNLFTKLENSHSIEESRKIIKDNEDLIEETLNKYDIPYSINYGNNYFPEKTYKGVNYEEGEYESLVISLGEAKGNNWWCVIYPPLCLIDQEKEENEYKFYIKEILDKFA